MKPRKRPSPAADVPPRLAARIREAVREKYGEVSRDAEGHFPYPVGREGALRLGYRRERLAAIPPGIVARFVGVGNPLVVRRPRRGETVLDAGCGAGLDAFLAARLVGPRGRAIGLDLTQAMLRRPREALAAGGPGNLELLEGSVEAIPLDDASVDLVISNGVLNLVPDKEAAFREVFRVLRPGGELAAADLVVIDSVPEEVLADIDAWSG